MNTELIIHFHYTLHSSLPLGIFSNDHMPYEHVKIEKGLDVPTLAEMTKKAIEILSRGPKGYFLLVSLSSVHSITICTTITLCKIRSMHIS